MFLAWRGEKPLSRRRARASLACSGDVARLAPHPTLSPEGRGLQAASVDAELLELVAQRPERDAELLRCRGLVVPRLLQRLHDGAALEVADVVVQPAVAGGARW